MSVEIKKDKKVALLFGASGLVGGHCLNYLLDHNAYKKVVSFGRRTLDISSPKLKEHVIDFDKMDQSENLIRGNDIFICLGTTRAKAGKEGFIKVDFDYSFCAAKIAAMNGANQIMLVSSVGADPNSFFLYPKTKGRLEEAVKKLPFWAIHIFQPSFLIGNREETRLGEQVATKVSSFINDLTDGMLKKYSPVEAEIVAQAMVNIAQGIRGGIHVYPSNEIESMVTDRRLVG